MGGGNFGGGKKGPLSLTLPHVGGRGLYRDCFDDRVQAGWHSLPPQSAKADIRRRWGRVRERGWVDWARSYTRIRADFGSYIGLRLATAG